MRNDVNIGPRFCRPGSAVRWITRTETDRFGGVSGTFYAAGASLAASASMTWRDSGRQAVPGQREQEEQSQMRNERTSPMDARHGFPPRSDRNGMLLLRPGDERDTRNKSSTGSRRFASMSMRLEHRRENTRQQSASGDGADHCRMRTFVTSCPHGSARCSGAERPRAAAPCSVVIESEDWRKRVPIQARSSNPFSVAPAN